MSSQGDLWHAVRESAPPEALLPRRAACRTGGWCAVLLVFTVTCASAAEAAKSPSDVVFLVELLFLILTGRLLGEAMARIGHSAIMGQLLAGVLLGPSVFGWLWPDLQHSIFPAAKEQRAMIDAISQFGILLLLLLTGMEIDIKLARKIGKTALVISLAGIAVPFACGVMLGWFMPETLLPAPGRRLLTSLFLGLALSISSIKIVAVIVREMKFMRRDLGQIIVASAIMEDTIGWIIIATVFGLAQANKIDAASVAKGLIGTAVFLAGSFTAGRRIVFHLIRLANDNFVSDFPVITTILVIMIAMALMTHSIGVHSVLGAFVSGVLVGQSPILTKHIGEQLRGLIQAFFMPVFLGMAGLSADLTTLKDPALLLITLALIAIASIGKFAGAFIGGEIGGLTRREALALACAMNARGTTEVIVATIGLSMGVLSQNLFTMIVAMAVTTTMAMPPMLRWALTRVPPSKAEKERLEREEFETKGFVANLERLLLAADESANGKFGSHIAGLIAGRSGMPTTVIQLGRQHFEKKKTNVEAGTTVGEIVKAAAEKTKKSNLEESEPASVDVTVRTPSDTTNQEAVTSEAKKGYDLLFIAVDKARSKDGTFNPEIDHIASGFEGPLAIVAGRRESLKQPDTGPFSILVPATGTGVSRRAAEIAIALGRASGCSITALYAVPAASTAGPQPRQRSLRERRNEQTILNDIVEMAGLYEIKVETATRSDIAPDEAILTEAKNGRHDLIIMGVNRRPGDKLFFGDTAASVFEKSPSSLLFLSS